MTMEESLKRGAEEISGVKDAIADVVRETIKENPEVDGQPVSEEEELNKPTYRLYNAIVDNIADNIKDEGFIDTITKMMNQYEVNHDMLEYTSQLVQLISVLIIQSTYSGIVTYDGLMKEELQVTFNNFAEAMNAISAEVKGNSDAMKVFRSDISNLKKTAVVKDINKAAGGSAVQ